MKNDKEIYKKAKGFDKNPQNINRTGQNRKLISSVNQELENSGIKETNKLEIVGCYLRLINCDIKTIEEMVKDTNQPALIRIVGKSILGGKGFEVIDKILDRGIGKAEQGVTLKSNIKVIGLDASDESYV